MTAAALDEKARTLLAEAKNAYLEALAPYRDACRRARTPCEFQGGRGVNVAERVAFVVERTDEGVRVVIKGQPETEEVIPLAELEKSINRVAYSFVERHVGPRETVGNKGGSLSNRLRKVMKS